MFQWLFFIFAVVWCLFLAFCLCLVSVSVYICVFCTLFGHSVLLCVSYVYPFVLFGVFVVVLILFMVILYLFVVILSLCGDIVCLLIVVFVSLCSHFLSILMTIQIQIQTFDDYKVQSSIPVRTDRRLTQQTADVRLAERDTQKATVYFNSHSHINMSSCVRLH